MQQSEKWPLPERVGAYAVGNGGAAVVALTSGLSRLDLENGTVQPWVSAPFPAEMCHFNDGRCDLLGRFVVGTVRRSHASERGGCALWRLHGSEITMLDEGFTVCNGIAFNRAADRLYLADSPEGIVYRYPYDPETGAVGARSVFADLPDGFFPDGASVDAEGGYWAALFGSGRIVRLDVEGRVDRVLRAPDKYPTMVAFAGPDLSTMVVTTARRYATIEYLELNPQSGGIFAAQVGAQGIPENLFGWS